MRRVREECRGTKRYVLSGYAVWVALLIGIYYSSATACASRPGALISLSGVAAILTGLVVNRPARKAPWILLAAALACFAAGQLSFLIAASSSRWPALPVVRGRALPVLLPAVRGRAADVHLLAHPGRRPAQPHRRADAHRRPRAAVVDLPDPALRQRPDADRAAEDRRDRLPARRRADARAAREAARAGYRHGPGASSCSPWAPSPACVSDAAYRCDPAARHVPQRDHHRPRLGPVLLRMGRRRAAPDHDPADRSGAKAAG